MGTPVNVVKVKFWTCIIEKADIRSVTLKMLLVSYETCHTRYHKETIKLSKTIHREIVFRDATFMVSCGVISIIGWKKYI
mgnify:CR=1 FL=1